MRQFCSSGSGRAPFVKRLCAIAAVVAIAALAGCASQPPAPPAPPPAAPPPPPAPHGLTGEQPNFLRLDNLPAGQTPVRVGVILPFSNGSAQTRALAQAMMKAAELALFDAHNPNLLLMSADGGSTPAQAIAAAQDLLDKGAEVIVGPLFSQSVSAVAPLARDHGVPVIAFSTDRGVGGDGVYLLSFQPENEVHRVVTYAASQGRTHFAALVPATAYGQHIAQALQDTAAQMGAQVVDVERFSPAGDDLAQRAAGIAAAKPDAVLIADGGTNLRTLAPMLVADGVDPNAVKLLGTGLWNDPSIEHEETLNGAWFAAPAPSTDTAFNAKFQDAYGSVPPQLATLAYDAVSLVALLAPGTAYRRFTPATLTDANGFAGVDGIFRFDVDGSSERGLAILGVAPDGFTVVDPAPVTFQKPAS